MCKSHTLRDSKIIQVKYSHNLELINYHFHRHNTKQCLLSSFSVVNFNSLCSVCNRASQKLAKLACGQDSSEVWLEDCPPTIPDIVTGDSMVFE